MVSKGPPLHSWLIKPQTLIFTLLIVFILIFGMAFKFGYAHYKSVIRETIHSNKTTAILLSSSIQQHQKAAIGIMRSYSRRPLLIHAVKKRDVKTVIRDLRSMKENNPEMDSVFIADKKGILWANFPVYKESHGKNFSYRDWYKGVSKDWKPYVSEVFRKVVAEKDLAVAICVPIFDEKGEILGILGTSQRVAFLGNIINQIGLEPYIGITLIDQGGHIIYSNWLDYQKEIVNDSSLALSMKTIQGKRGTAEVKEPSEDGEIKYVAFSSVEEIGWSVIVERRRYEVLKSEVGTFVQGFVISILLFLLIVLSLVYFRKEFLYKKTKELLQAEETLRKSEEEARQLAQENVIIAEIGRIISSSLNIDEVCERFAEEMRKLIPFDRIAINLIHPDQCTTTVAYTSGAEIPERFHGDTVPLTGTFTETVMRARKSHLVQDEENEIISRFPGLRFSLNVGLRSMMSVPLFSKDEVIGVLHIRSTKPNAYSERDLKLAERVGNQIAGAIANAQLFAERKQAEEALRKSEEESKRIAQENAIMAEIGRIISSSLNIDEVYERFAEEVRKLIPFGRISVNLISPDENILTIAYFTGIEIEGRQTGDRLPIGPMTREALQKKAPLVIQTNNGGELAKRYPHLLHSSHGKFISFLMIPLFSKDQIFGVLRIRSTKPNAYSERDLKLAERVGNQIAGAIANAQLFSERVRAEQKTKNLEAQLRQSQKIEAIGRLAGGIAHDFNNLLTVIKGYSELSLIKLKEGDPLKGNIEEIRKASQRAADLTHQLLAFSRRQILEFKVIDLNTILRNLDKMLRRVIGEDIELIYLLSDHLGKIKSDPGQIEQMILNLALNARDAMPSGGKLTIKTADVEFDETYARTHIGVKPGYHIMLSVSDTGCGLSPEAKEHLFEPFFTTKEKGKGTGLGLSTAYGIAKQSEGDIEAYSELGQGTTFKIYLPRVEGEIRTLQPEDDKSSLSKGRETILLVEDELAVRSLGIRVLRENGYNLLEAANGNEALRMAQEYAGEIHLLLTDVVMPQMGGKELANRLKTLRPSMKVLFTSGYTDDAIVHHGVLDPGIEFIQKPFSPAAFAQKVRGVLDK